MIEVSCSIDEAAMGRLENLLNGIAEAAPQKLASETRHAAIYICQSLRARTKSAPKRIPRREYEATVSAVPPKYVHSNSAHHRLLRRWTLARKIGTPDAYAKHYYVYTDRHRVKGGKMAGGSLAAERRELLKEHGGIQHYGLAKKSWGWTMKQIYSGTAAGDLSWKRGKHDRRDPRQFVRVHRAHLVAIDYIAEIRKTDSSRLNVILRDKDHTQILVSRNFVKTVRNL